MLLTRRQLLRHSTLLALGPTVPAFLARAARAAEPDRDGRVLVVVQLDGGNDGVNTVVPYTDEGYAKHRKALRLPADRLVKLNDNVGLHPAMADAGRLLEGGRLAVVQGVGYPNPSRSHFESMAVWHTARRDPEEHGGPGWIGRAFDALPAGRRERTGALLVGAEQPPAALRGRRFIPSALDRIEDLTLAAGADPRPALARAEPAGLAGFVQRSMLDAYADADRLAALARTPDASDRYPGTGLSGHLRLVARLLKAGAGARVFYLRQGNYDTHASQPPAHAQLLGELAGGLKAFLDDLAAAGLAERVAILCFSEFGRRVAENGSQGTDHGTAGPVLLAGPGVRAGLVGAAPSLTALVDGDLKVGIDFRRVYATVLDDWLGLPAEGTLGAKFEKLPLFRA